MLKPLKNKVIVSVEKSDKTKGGLMITTSLETDSVLGKIVAVSDSYSGEEKINVGTTVIISKFSGSKIQHDNAEYLVIDIDSILAIVEEE